MNLNQVFSHMEKEYQGYLDAIARHPNSPIDEYVIMDECLRMLPILVPDELVDSVLTQFHGALGGKQSMAKGTVKELVAAMFLAQKTKSGLACSPPLKAA